METLKFALYLDRDLTSDEVDALVRMVDVHTKKKGIPHQSHCIHVSCPISNAERDITWFNQLSHAGLNVSLLGTATPYALSTFKPNSYMRKAHKQIITF